jgi:ABC-type uncharacterized transport system ATPase subunit
MNANSPLLQMEGIYKTFPGVVANDHIDFSVREGEIHGLLGENGAGKSTLMKVLFGLYDADDGSIQYDGEPLNIGSPEDAIDSGLGMVHQHFQLIPKLTVAENVVLGLREPYKSTDDSEGGLLGFGPVQRLSRLLSYNESRQKERVAEVADEYGIDIDPEKTVSELDIGEQQRVEILKALYRDADLLVLDEPTAVLTPGQIERLFETLRNLTEQGLTIIIITHKLDEVTDITDRVTVLREGKRIDTVETATVDESDLARMMVGREVIRDIEKTSASVGDTVLEASNLHTEDNRGVEVLSGVDLTVREGEILGLAGVSGNGQQELTDCILGKKELTDGSLTLNGTTLNGVPSKERVENGLSIVPADRHEAGCAPELSIVHNSVIKDYRSEQFGSGPLGIGIDYDAAREHADSLLEKYDVRAPNADVAAGNLSGGNLQKLILGRELDRDPSLLIANQPTRGLDVGAVESVRQRLLDQRKQGTGILLVSEKLNEIMELSDRIAVIYEGEIVYETDGESADRGNIGVYMSSGTKKKSDTADPETGGEQVGTQTATK